MICESNGWTDGWQTLERRGECRAGAVRGSVREGVEQTSDSVMQEPFDAVVAVVQDLRTGKIVIMVDDADRENEGDLIMAAERVTPEAVNFMAKHGRGLICVPTTHERLQQLGIEQMVVQNRETFKTDFQVSVDAARGITTGISAADRAQTIRVMADPTALPDDLVQPGHAFRCAPNLAGFCNARATPRRRWTWSGLRAAARSRVICEIMSEDGSMARLPELLEFAQSASVAPLFIEALIHYRRTRKS